METDGLALRRDPRHGFDVASLDGNIVLSTRDFNYDFQMGGRVLLGHTLNECFQVEGVFFTIADWQDSRAVRNTTPNTQGGNGNLFSPFSNFGTTPSSGTGGSPFPGSGSSSTAGLDFNNFASIRYRAALDNVEINIRRQLPLAPERLAASLLFGVRYMNLPEQFEYSTQSAVPLPGSANYIRVETGNALVGPQIGALLEFYVENRWWVNLEIKGMLATNFAQQSTFFNPNNIASFPSPAFTSVSENHTAFVGDLSVTGVYRWSPHLSTRIGYQAMWAENLALAAENLNTDINIIALGPAQLNHQGRTVYHGPQAGMTLSW